MSLKQQFEKKMQETGGTFELDDYSGRTISLCITSPEGMVWKCNSCHSVDASVFRNKGSRDFLYKGALDDISKGVEPCEIGPMCDFCNPEDDEE